VETGFRKKIMRKTKDHSAAAPERKMDPIRIWYQSYVDEPNGRIYWDRLRRHLAALVDPARRSTSRASPRTTTTPIRSSNSAARGR